ncbi:MAG: argininosuccinate synthase [Candidatus Hecatellaceae archaeon]|nr:MAG: argininosuccinate synthase [Candidatus Hecatellales archaeon]
MEKVVFAYSGGLDTSVMIRWLIEKYDVDVVTVTVDVGQQEDLKAIEEKALKVGASRHYSIDARKEFAEKFLWASVKANALYQGKYPLSTALSRPLIASKLVEVARKEKAEAIAHGCTGRGNDQVRFEVSLKALAPEMKIIAPVREWNLSREMEIAYAREKGIPIPVKDKPYSIDQNLWGRSVECGPLDDPAVEPPEDAFEWTVQPEKAPDTPQYITLGFDNGVPVALNGREMEAVKLIEELNSLAGRHGVGRIDHVEDRTVGLKTREVYECPAALTLIEAHRDLEKLTLTRSELTFKHLVDLEWTWLVYSGLWVDPLRRELEAFIEESQKGVTGEVKIKLFKGSLSVVGRKALTRDLSLTTRRLAEAIDQTLAKGFIEHWGLQAVARSLGKTEEDR